MLIKKDFLVWLRLLVYDPIFLDSHQINPATRLPDQLDKPQASLLNYIESVGNKQVNSFEQLTTAELVEKAYQVTGPICYQYATVLAELVESCFLIEKAHGIKPIKLLG